MDTSNNIYELFILLGNEITMCLPYCVKNDRISCQQLHSSKIPSILNITDSQISIGKMQNGNQEVSKGQDICGFVDSFFGLISESFVSELKKQCTCEVLLTSHGQVEYRVKDLRNQILTPAIVLKLFLEYLILYECRRSNILIKNITIAYPVYCTRYHEEYLVYLLRSLDPYTVKCVNQLPCFITSLMPIERSPSTSSNVLLLYAGYSLFHIFACTVSDQYVVIRRYFKSTRVSHQSFLKKIYDDILVELKARSFSAPSSEELFKACYHLLARLTVQTVASVNIIINEDQLIHTVTDNGVYRILKPVLNSLTLDLDTVLADLHWTATPVILTGQSSSIFVYRRWLQEDFHNVPFCSCYDIAEMILHGMNPALPVKRSISEEVETRTLFSILSAESPNFALPSSVLSAIREENQQIKSKITQERVSPTTSEAFPSLTSRCE